MEAYWERAYEQEAEGGFFGAPSAEIVRLAGVLPPGARCLDLGCGDGRHALFLAGKGFRVEAFDLSEAGVARLQERAGRRGLDVRAWVEDAGACTFPVGYDVIIAHGVLHLLPRVQRERVLARMKEGTRPGGIHVVAVFTDRLPPPQDQADMMLSLFAEGELRRCYDDWEVASYDAYVKEDEHPGGIRHRHPIEKIVARRPST